jgi:hypothetical protein
MTSRTRNRVARHPPPKEVGVLKHCGLKLFTSGKLTKLGCLGIRVGSVGAVVPWSMGVCAS